MSLIEGIIDPITTTAQAFLFFFSLLLLFCMLSTIFLCDNGVYEAFLFQFLNCYSLLNDGNSPFWTQQISPLNESECIVGTPKGWETWLETHAPLLVLIGRIIFLTLEKKIVLDSGWTYNSYAQCLRLKNNSCMCTAIDLWKSNDTLNRLLNYLATYRTLDRIYAKAPV